MSDISLSGGKQPNLKSVHFNLIEILDFISNSFWPPGALPSFVSTS